MGLIRSAGSGASILPNNVAVQGYADFNNAGAAQTLTAGTWVALLNDSAGPNTIIDKMPKDIAITVDAVTGNISFTGMQIEDQIFIRHDFTITPQTNNQTFTFKNEVGTSPYPIGTHTQKMEQGGNVSTETINPFTWVYIGDSNTLNGGITPKIKTSGPSVIQYNGFAVSILKRNS